jgi:phosphoribosyl-AMP cyclohydrolase
VKGDTSGHVQHVRGCDWTATATLLVVVDQAGAACHTVTGRFDADLLLKP